MYKFKINKISLLAFVSFVIALMMQLLFVTLREPMYYQSDRQETAKLDAAYYNYLIKNEIHSLDDLTQKTPNIETSFFLGLLFAQKIIGITDETIRAIFNLFILFLLMGAILARQNLNQKTAVLFQLALAPIIIYTSLPTKETFIFFGLAALLISTVTNKTMSKIWLLSGILIIFLARPIFGLQVIIAAISTEIIISKAWKSLTAYFLSLSLLFLLYFKEIIAIGYIYQTANIDNDMSTCKQIGINTCFNGDGGIEDAIVFFVRILMWVTTRFIKGFNDIINFNYSAGQSVEYFEIYINAINVLAPISILLALIIRKKINFGANQEVIIKINIFSKILILLIAFVAGGIAFYQTQRVYALVFCLLFIMIATNISKNVKKF